MAVSSAGALWPAADHLFPGGRAKSPYWVGVGARLAARYSVPRYTTGEFMAKPPNYKQNKKRREDAQKKSNAEKQQRKASRKGEPFEPGPGTPAQPPAKPAGS